MGGMLLGAALAGAAQGYGKYVDDENKREDDERKRQQSISDRRDALLQEMRLKEEYAIAGEERKEQRKKAEEADLIAATQKAGTRAEEIGADRRYSTFKKDGLAAGYFEGMSEDEIKKVFKDNYDDRQVTTEAGGDRYLDKTREIKAQDRLKASQETGNTGLISTALKSVDDARSSDVATETQRRNQENERRNRERDDQKHAETMERMGIDSRRLDIYASKGGSSSGGGRADPTYRLALTTQLNAANRDVTELRKSLEAFDDNLVNKTSTDPAVAVKRKQLQSDLDEAIQTKKSLLKQFDGLGAQPSDEGSTKPSGSKPSGGQSGTGSVATPKSNAEFNSLPKGALYVNPKDGKTYTKN